MTRRGAPTTSSVVCSSGDRTSADELLRDADIALYAAKAAGKNGFVIYEPHMQAAVQDRFELQAHQRGSAPAT
jgi:predicted signal transduction protein with EAL and GGDEF domain